VQLLVTLVIQELMVQQEHQDILVTLEHLLQVYRVTLVTLVQQEQELQVIQDILL